ncbi:hypothetical protein [Vibrio vulnificus]|uniref:Uncharacterized protein n=1 Tax=Vibrio vulnificus TaxID=672 RepID=A0A2S3QYQ9_VIBVL|nr:hypothetical protein [Vibrio vulnificus]POB44048.1 hypothetical protein CRN52_20235 [Vibrio vulnificus]RAH31793.1 hypothetical protein DOT36_02650 [Vibrio vulnificus]
MIAVQRRHTEVTAVLLRRGADLQDRHGDIWCQATQQLEIHNIFGESITLEQPPLRLLDQLDETLSREQYTLANALANALPNQHWCDGVVITLDHFHTFYVDRTLICKGGAGVVNKNDGDNGNSCHSTFR